MIDKCFIKNKQQVVIVLKQNINIKILLFVVFYYLTLKSKDKVCMNALAWSSYASVTPVSVD